MRVYLAAPYAARDRIRAHAEDLVELGMTVTSTWLQETHEISASTIGVAGALDDATAAGHALQDLADITDADVLVLFTAAAAGVEGSAGTTGGRHVETGYAIGFGLPVVVVGSIENVFHRIGLPQVQVTEDWLAARQSLMRRFLGECVVCACTEDAACEAGCAWVAPNLCSECA